MPKEFDKVIISEGGYIVEFSNKGGLRGTKAKKNPNPVNYRKQMITCRIEGCENGTSNISGICTYHQDKKEKIRHTVDWIGRIIVPGKTREDCLTWAPAHSTITEILVKWMKDDPERREGKMDTFIDDLLDTVVGEIPDATTMQEDLEGGKSTPDEVIEKIREVVDRNFPEKEFSGMKLDGGRYKKTGLKDIPIRVVATLLAVAFASEESNRGDLWFAKRFREGKGSKYASAFMPSVYYLLRRHTKANEKQAKMSLK